eukprot:6459900-Alexandrium_andersonii.AAC.1
MAVRIDKPPGAATSDAVIATWADGTTSVVSDITCAEWDVIVEANSKRGKKAVVIEWEGQHGPSGERFSGSAQRQAVNV